MKTLITAIFAAGVSLTALSSAQAITAAQLAEAAKNASPVVDIQKKNSAGGCKRGYRMTRNGCRRVNWNS